MKSPQNNLRDEKDEKSSKSQKVEEEKKSQDDEVLEITTNSESKTEREMKLYKEVIDLEFIDSMVSQEEEESGEPLYVESNDFQESDPISPDTEEGYVQVTHQDSYPEDISKIRNDDMEEETPPQEPTQDDDAILE